MHLQLASSINVYHHAFRYSFDYVAKCTIKISSAGESGSEESCSDSQEEDQHLWEEQQIGKGVKRHQVSVMENLHTCLNFNTK